MSDVIVQFFGICTHVTTEDGSYRVILPKAGEERIAEHAPLRDQGVQPHVARLQILSTDLLPGLPESFAPQESNGYLTWELDGVWLSIRDAAAPRHTPVIPEGDTFPRLCAFTRSDVKLRGELEGGGNDAALRDIADCIFTFPNVTPVPMRTNVGQADLRATVGVVTVDTPRPAIVVQRFGGSDKVLIPVKAGTQITVFSYPTSAEVVDKNADFLLHFLSMTEVPTDYDLPPEGPWKECTTEIVTNNAPAVPGSTEVGAHFTGPGCSNSNYP
jgi:hypothetical protein